MTRTEQYAADVTYRADVDARAAASDVPPGVILTEDAHASRWRRVFFIRPSGARVDVAGLNDDDSEDYVIQAARHNARPDETEIEVEYQNGTRRRFDVRPEDRPRHD